MHAPVQTLCSVTEMQPESGMMKRESISQAVDSWALSLGPLPTQGSDIADKLMLQTRSLASALRAQDVSQATISSILAVFETGVALCIQQQQQEQQEQQQLEQQQQQQQYEEQFPMTSQQLLHSAGGLRCHHQLDMDDGTIFEASKHFSTGSFSMLSTDSSTLSSEDGSMESLKKTVAVGTEAQAPQSHHSHSCYGHAAAAAPGFDGYADAVFFSQKDSFELYDMFGGWEGLTAAVDSMYHRLMLDPRTTQFFAGRPRARLMRHMTAFLSSAMLGKSMYSAHDLHGKHCHMIEHEGLGPQHVDVMCEHLEAVLRDIGTSSSAIASATRAIQKQKAAFAKKAPAGFPSGLGASGTISKEEAKLSASLRDVLVVGPSSNEVEGEEPTHHKGLSQGRCPYR